MAQFTNNEWDKIDRKLQNDPARYGFPERIYGSALLGSFNIRKLGATKARNERTWKFLAHICGQFDLLAIQEVMDDLSGLRKLKDLLGPDFGMIVSDKTGAFPGDPGLGERLAFVFNWHVVNRTEIATDITYDRSKILTAIARNNDALHDAIKPLATYQEQLREWEDGKRTRKPRRRKIKLPTFLSFIRSPFCVSFEISGHPGTEPYQFMAINAHLHFGDYMSDRRQEFEALMDWIMGRVEERDKAYYPNFILLGDLNLDYDNPKRDRRTIEQHLKTLDSNSRTGAHVNFPFLDRHRGERKVFRTNARLNETYDQIGLFFRDKRFPSHEANSSMGQVDQGPDYGVFDFVNLFSEALLGKRYSGLSKKAQAALVARFEHKVSDHLPLWLRLPLPKH